MSKRTVRLLTNPKFDLVSQPDISSIWIMRLLLGALLLLGGEVLLWNNPPAHDLLEWFVIIIGYGVSALIMLDLAVRYRIRNLYDVMTLLIVYVMLVALFIKPQIAFDDFPNKFIQRILGGEAFVGIEMFGLFLIMTRANAKRGRFLLLMYAIAVGFYWGIWVRWSPLREDIHAQIAPLNLMIGYFAFVGLLVLLLFLRMSRRHSVWSPEQLLLGQREMGLVLIICVLLFTLRLVQGLVAFSNLLVFIILVALAIGVLYYRKPEKAVMLMDKHIPPQPLKWGWLIIASLIVVIAATLAYVLPYIPLDTVNQLSILELAFAGIGFLWLPVIAIVFSTEALDRQSRAIG